MGASEQQNLEQKAKVHQQKSVGVTQGRRRVGNLARTRPEGRNGGSQTYEMKKESKVVRRGGGNEKSEAGKQDGKR